ncbi:two-component system response regulator [Aliidiomarina taiwanensis]|uniref:Two-component system response regulator n=1 Tax=Aliidiomarina taiwanensis TaxID=946228 RepID=A0A432X208_9GAMM|nr:response regulator [Aliidiomarina taiwanensis]RUO40596.1 two-component system response regulator [Aliidiomarina taiwanensis]
MVLHVLLVDDNARARESVLAMLNPAYFQVTVAEDGLGGLNLAKKQPFDVVLTDHKMPIMDGIALIRNLSELPSYKNTPLCLMTTGDVAQVRERAERVGADHVLAKPLDESLLQLLNSYRQRDIV